MSRRRARPPVPAVALAAALALVGTGCTGGGDPDPVGARAVPTAVAPTSTTTTAPPATTTTAPPATTTTVAPPTQPGGRAPVPVAAGDPAGLAAQLAAAESTVRDPGGAEADVARAAHVAQVAYRALAARPEWDADVAGRLPEALRPVVAANVGAARELSGLVRPQELLPAWRIVAPEPAEALRRHYEAAEAEFGVPWEYLAAVHLTETRMGRIRGESSAGAQGPMQFLPSTWEAYGEGDIEDTGDAVRAAARYLAANGAPADMAGALFRYNPTPRYVNAVTAYAEQMRADERAHLGYHHWQVHYTTVLGPVWLREGYAASEPRPVTPPDLG